MEFEEGKIVKKKDGWYLYSKDGSKKLGGPYSTYKECLKRLREVEFYKHKK